MDTENMIAVLGGSFNPPTSAHLILLEHVMDHTGAARGLFVPSSHTYVARKAQKQSSPFLFTEQERLDMLLAMVDGKDGLDIDTCEYGDTSRGRTYETLCCIQERNPGHDICFVTGADKLGIIPRWKSAEALLSRFHLAVLSRDDIDAKAAIQANPLLRAHESTIHVVPGLPGIERISSSRFQRQLAAGDPQAAHMVVPAVMERVEQAVARREKSHGR